MKIPPWVPADAKAAIESWAGGDLSAEMHAVLVRLATFDTMREVWAKLPPDNAETVIGLALFAYAYATPAASQPFGPPARELAASARLLADHLTKETVLGERWDRLWPGEPLITVDQFVAVLRQMAEHYDLTERETLGKLQLLGMSTRSRKRRASTAPHIFFVRTMGRWFDRIYGPQRRLHAVVAALTTVVFNVDPPVSDETAREWRRNTRG